MIEINSFSKKYKDFFAVKDISFSVFPGTVTGLLGVNGAGKTTILKAICGIHYGSEGKILVQNYDVVENSVIVRQLIGYVSEQPALISYMNVTDFLNYAASIRFAEKYPEKKLRKKHIKNSIENVCDIFKLDSVMDKKISDLSKGFKQRVSFAQALLHNPPILILDEPISGLDPAQIHQMRNLIRSIACEKTVLLSTHLMQEVEALCSTVHIINDGCLVASGSTENIIKNTKSKDFEEAFLKISTSEWSSHYE